MTRRFSMFAALVLTLAAPGTSADDAADLAKKLANRLPR